MSDHHAPTGHEAPAAAAPAAEGSKIVQQVLWVLAVLFLILAIVTELSSDVPKTGNITEWFQNIDFGFGAPKLGEPSDKTIIAEHTLKVGEVWATDKLTGKMTIDADGHKFSVQFTGCDEFTEFNFNGKQTSFPSCAEAGPALIKMGNGEKKPFTIRIIQKKSR